MRRPRALPPGGTIGIVNPSSPVEPDLLYAGIAALEARGFRVVVAPHVRDRYGHLAGRDVARAADFLSFYADPSIDIVWCARGGSSACRLWPLLDWNVLAALPPKMVIGYSDTTSLLIPLNQRVNTTALHGPLVFELGKERRPLTPSLRNQKVQEGRQGRKEGRHGGLPLQALIRLPRIGVLLGWAGGLLLCWTGSCDYCRS